MLRVYLWLSFMFLFIFIFSNAQLSQLLNEYYSPYVLMILLSLNVCHGIGFGGFHPKLFQHACEVFYWSCKGLWSRSMHWYTAHCPPFLQPKCVSFPSHQIIFVLFPPPKFTIKCPALFFFGKLYVIVPEKLHFAPVRGSYTRSQTRPHKLQFCKADLTEKIKSTYGRCTLGKLPGLIAHRRGFFFRQKCTATPMGRGGMGGRTPAKVGGSQRGAFYSIQGCSPNCTSAMWLPPPVNCLANHQLTSLFRASEFWHMT